MIGGGGGFKGGNMPKSVTCYICGRGYGTASIAIHLKTCQQKWEVEQAKKPPKERRMLPRPPPGFVEALARGRLSEDELLEINNNMFREYKETALERCDFCGRTFNAEAMKVHRRLCTADKPHMPLPKDRALSQPKHKPPPRPAEEEEEPAPPQKASSGGKPPGDFVIFQNLRKDQKQAASKSTAPQKSSEPPRAEPPRPRPPKPEAAARPKRATEDNFDELPVARGKKKSQMPEEVNYNMLSNECAKCGRRFAMDRIDKHQSVCKVNAKPKKVKRFHKPITKKEKSSLKAEVKSNWKEQHKNFMEVMAHMKKIKRVEEQGGDVRAIAPLPSAGDSRLLPCDYCGRRFNPAAHEKHVKFCASKAKDVSNARKSNFREPDARPAKPAKSPALDKPPEREPRPEAKKPRAVDLWTDGKKPAKPADFGLELPKPKPAAKPPGRRF